MDGTARKTSTGHVKGQLASFVELSKFVISYKLSEYHHYLTFLPEAENMQ